MTGTLAWLRHRRPSKAQLVLIMLAMLPVLVAFCDGGGRHTPF